MAPDSNVDPAALDPPKVVETLAEVRERPPPNNPSSAGCVTAIVAIIALVFMPVIARIPALTSGVLVGIGAVLIVVAIVGGLVGIFGGGFVAGAISTDVEEAIEQLLEAFPNGNPAVLREAAVRILDGSTVTTGPTTVETFDRHEVEDRLGDALPFVMAVERILLERKEIYPCFTLSREWTHREENPWE